ncbi:hypothetical protein E4T39_08238 [Aureobasidium subglaciale]|nr:hypothetical protein E4T39_08238 [Aureobasidium subglaciale]
MLDSLATTPTGLPPELDLFVDFVSADDRPTLILDTTNSRFLVRNDALDALASKTSWAPWAAWIDGLRTTLHRQAGRRTRRAAKLDNHASRSWACMALRGPWIAVFCRQDSQNSPSTKRAVQSTEVRRLNPHVLSRNGQETDYLALGDPDDPMCLDQPGDEHDSAQSGTAKKESVNDDTKEPGRLGQNKPETTPNPAGKTTNSPRDCHQAPRSITLTQDFLVDWLAYPQYTADPWIQFIVKHDWHNTVAGPISTWHPTLRQVYSTIISSTEPRVLYWGDDLCMFYNEAARFLVGEMHPASLGRPLAEVWGAPMCAHLTDILITGIKQGKPIQNRRTELVIKRNDYPDSCFFDFVFLPIPSPEGRFMGFINEFTETTTNVLQENRQEVCKSLIEHVTRATTADDIWTGLMRTLQQSQDVSFAAVYACDLVNESMSDSPSLRIQCSFGLENAPPMMPSTFKAAARGGGFQKVTVLDASSNTMPPEFTVNKPDVGDVRALCLLPVVGLYGQTVSAIAIVGSNPQRPVDTSSLQFLEALRDLLFKSVALLSLPAEQRRANELLTAISHQLEVATSKAEKSEKSFTEMVHNAPIGMCMDRGDEYPIYVNDTYLDFMCADRESFFKAAKPGFSWRSTCFENTPRTVEGLWRSAIKHRETTSFEIRMQPNGSRSRWFEVFVQPRCDENGQLKSIFSWLTDISARKLMESVAEERLSEAIENKRSSENFIDMISHEMRNPLSSILQLADGISSSLPLLEDNEHSSPSVSASNVLSEETRAALLETAETITICANHQKAILDDVLTFSKLDSKLIVLAPESVQPVTLLNGVMKMTKSELAHADILCSLDIQSSYTDLGIDRVLLDPSRVLQILINFMTNAIKFTKTSDVRKIRISLGAAKNRPTAEDCQVMLIEPRNTSPIGSQNRGAPVSKEIYLLFSVHDTGCGITESGLKNLFQRFSQASPKTYKEYGGSGLGLFISRELVELQGGQVGVRSEAGRGSTFAFFIKVPSIQPYPLVSTMSTTPIRATAANLVPVMAQQLRKLGCEKVHVANHGLEALDFLAETAFCNGETPLSIILLDVEMPIMNGLTCARRVRELEKKREILEHVPICGITANARPDQIASCIEAGMDEVVVCVFRLTFEEGC